jgi:hypothetical protein
MRDAGYWILDAGYWMRDTGYWMLDAGYWILDMGYLILDGLLLGNNRYLPVIFKAALGIIKT